MKKRIVKLLMLVPFVSVLPMSGMQQVKTILRYLGGKEEYTKSLDEAVNKRRVDSVRYWLSREDIDVNAVVDHEHDYTAFMKACEFSKAEIVREFLACDRVNVNTANTYGITGLMAAVANNNIASIKELLACKRIDINYKSKWYEKTVLMEVLERRMSNIAELLISKGADIFASDRNGKTILMYAVESGNLSVAALLISKGADIFSSDSNGKTILMYAVESGNLSVVKLLISKGADINARDKNGKTALIMAADCKKWNVVKFFTKRGAKVEKVYIEQPNENGETLLMNSVVKQNHKEAEILVTLGANPYRKDIDDCNAFDYAQDDEKMLVILKETKHKLRARL